jgi:hypothetical protein
MPPEPAARWLRNFGYGFQPLNVREFPYTRMPSFPTVRTGSFRINFAAIVGLTDEDSSDSAPLNGVMQNQS